MAAANTAHPPPVEDLVTSVELTSVQVSTATTASKAEDAPQTTVEISSEPVKQRGTFRTFTVMLALFVSIYRRSCALLNGSD